ncbi:BBP7 family outer membrane beta-barrel protein [Lignipirellula cremea]|uniref:Outer membrane protein beta-barrel domain-containing protein n=1 Tax=Lignipirellula cremea TaxID=2528010 RepID=A0A518E1D8_9BACT|nr:BBP7 family outer membrane beta-barrel protein [Lignipirellula cremea]QDU97892.1 hypothetical protein Pla8534_57490 [Lignipirellula cremea]
MTNRKLLSSCIALLALAGIAQAEAPHDHFIEQPAPPGEIDPSYGPSAPIDIGCSTGCTSGCSTGCCSQTCCCAPDCWQVYAGAMFLSRDYDNAPIFTDAGGNTIVGADDLDSGLSPGFELSARRNNWEVRYFQVDSMSATTEMEGVGNFLGGGFAGVAGLSYDTEIYNAEVNYFYNPPSDMLRAFAGFRYIGLDEELGFQLNGANLDRLTTDNDLYGFQVGVDGALWRKCNSRFYVNGVAKAGVYYADTEVHNTVLDTNQQLDDNSDRVAFVGEIGVTAGYEVTNWLALEAGYQFLWLDGVALAGEQASSVNPFTQTASINHGDAIYHGLRLGATARW